jgi:hypothetical protein
MNSQCIRGLVQLAQTKRVVTRDSEHKAGARVGELTVDQLRRTCIFMSTREAGLDGHQRRQEANEDWGLVEPEQEG